MACDLRGFELNKGEIVLVSFEDRLNYAVIVQVLENTGAVDAELIGSSFAAPLSHRFLFPNTQCYLVFDHTGVPIELLERAMELRGDYIEHQRNPGDGRSGQTDRGNRKETESYQPNGG